MTGRGATLVALAAGMLLLSARCGGGLTDSPEKLHEMMKLFAAHKDYDNLLALFTLQGRARIADDRHAMVQQLRKAGAVSRSLTGTSISEWHRGPKGEPVNALETYGFETYLELSGAPVEEVFGNWCERRAGWSRRVERMAHSERVAAPRMVGSDRAVLTVRYADGKTEALEMYRHKGQWYASEKWLLKADVR